jgi:hypothetical protein
MRTGNAIKLVGYMNRLAKCISNGITIVQNPNDDYDTDYDACEQSSSKRNMVVMADSHMSKYVDFGSRSEHYYTSRIYVGGYSVDDTVRKLSGDNEAGGTLNITYRNNDTEVEYDLELYIDGVEFHINADGWE